MQTHTTVYDRIRTYTTAYERIPNTDTHTNPYTQANADADTNASAFAYTQAKTSPDPHPKTGRKALRRRARRCVGRPHRSAGRHSPFHRGFPLFPQNYPQDGRSLSAPWIF